jgi:septin family protein
MSLIPRTGESGLGKTTLVNTLFQSDLLPSTQKTLYDKTVDIVPHQFGTSTRGGTGADLTTLRAGGEWGYALSDRVRMRATDDC